MDGIFTTRFVDPYLRAHKWVYERSDGRVGKHSNRVPALLLTTTGRKSGLARTNGLTYCTDRGDLVVVASNGGSDRHPAWLPQHPGRPPGHRAGRPPVSDGDGPGGHPEEREQLWPKVNRTNRGMSRLFHPGVQGRYDVYQRHTSRRIPVVIIRLGPRRRDGPEPAAARPTPAPQPAGWGPPAG